MIFDILGITLAYASIMLFFGVVVTIIIQFVQSTFDMRYHNLKNGLMKIADNVDAIPSEEFKSGLDNMLLYGSAQSVGKIKRLASVKKTEVTSQELDRYIEKNIKDSSKDMKEGALELFDDAEQYMSKRFHRIMSNLSIFIGITLAFAFQLNSFDLLRQISMDPDLRENYISIIEGSVVEYEKVKDPQSFSDIAKGALEQLEKNHPSIGEKIEEASGEVSSIDEAVAELKIVLGDDTLVSEYETLIEESISDNYKNAKEALNRISSKSTMYNFNLWPYGLEYYSFDFYGLRHIIGTLISGILISLGAPFWFNAIKNITSMRDESSKRS